ncbi:MAG: hypothetical protein KAI83_10765 [Thiomargarita sp.]|nr:hypothetical protein [Thiomargarita sp.]
MPLRHKNIVGAILYGCPELRVEILEFNALALIFLLEYNALALIFLINL